MTSLATSLLDPSEGPEAREARLLAVADALMRRAEQSPEHIDLAYSQFERAALLEAQIEARTRDLAHTLDLLQDSNARLSQAMKDAEAARLNLAQAIETVEGGFALFGADDRLVMCNSRFCADFPGLAAILEPGLPFEAYVEAVSRNAELNLPADSTREAWAAMRMMRHGDAGTAFDVSLTRDRWVQVSEQRTENGGTVVLQTDVTSLVRRERRQREQAIDRQARMARATLDHLAQAVAVFDRNGRLLGCNAEWEAVVGQAEADTDLSTLLDRLEGRFEFSSGMTRAKLKAWSRRAQARQPLRFEMRHRTRSTTTTTVYDVFGNEMPEHGFVFSFMDVTSERRAIDGLRELADDLERRVSVRTEELDRALQEAKRANASKSRFVAAASHDLMQPLSAAKLFVGALEDGAVGDRASELARRAISALGSVETLIETLLDIARFDSGGTEVDIHDIALGAIFEGLHDEIGPLAAKKGQTLHVAPTTAKVRTDPVLIKRVIQNLVGNAVRHSTGHRILLCARRAGTESVRVEVRDAGPGIAEGDQKVVFEEFRQLSRQDGQGLGLGLAVVERICALLGHKLSLRSEVGRGSTFGITLPIAKIGAENEGPEKFEQTTPPSGALLGLVENDTALSDALTAMIEGWGSEVISAASAEEMLQLLEELDILPDVFLVDFQLGEGMNGLELVSELRRRFGLVPSVIVSADRSERLALECSNRELDLVQKPIDRHRLALALNTVIQNDRKEQKNSALPS